MRDPATQIFDAVWQIVDAAELGHDYRVDAGPRGRRDLRVGNFVRTDALAVVFDEDVRQDARGHVAIAFARPARQYAARRKAVGAQDGSVFLLLTGSALCVSLAIDPASAVRLGAALVAGVSALALAPLVITHGLRPRVHPFRTAAELLAIFRRPVIDAARSRWSGACSWWLSAPRWEQLSAGCWCPCWGCRPEVPGLDPMAASVMRPISGVLLALVLTPVAVRLDVPVRERAAILFLLLFGFNTLTNAIEAAFFTTWTGAATAGLLVATVPGHPAMACLLAVLFQRPEATRTLFARDMPFAQPAWRRSVVGPLHSGGAASARATEGGRGGSADCGLAW